MTTISKDPLAHLLDGRDLSEDQAASLMSELAMGELPPARAGALLAALRAKGETADEIRGFAREMRARALVPPIAEGIAAADCVGTGGDGSGSYNLSTGTALLAAACGVPMVKHGNRSVSSKSGSADVLEALGLQLPQDPVVAAHWLEKTGFTFLFAPVYHPAMKAVVPVRKAMGVRTVFNVLGPLTNPAAPPYGLIGAFSEPVAELMANALAGLPLTRAFVIHGHNGWDEATPVAPFTVFDVRPGAVSRSVRTPADYGIAECAAADLAGGDAQYNAAGLAAVLKGEDTGAHRDALLLGTALLLEVTGRAADARSAMHYAAERLQEGAGRDLLARLGNLAGG